jgi:hypothetical protein
MNRKGLAVGTLVFAVALLGSLPLNVLADDIGTSVAASQGSFAATVPTIPGYNAPYPFLEALQATGGEPALVEGGDMFAFGPVDGFARTAPVIPGYNAAYPDLSTVVAQ